MAEVKLGTTSSTYDELSMKYSDFMAPIAKVTIDGVDTKVSGMALTRVRVQTSTTNEVDTAVITIANAYDEVDRDFLWQDKVKLGSTLEVEFGYVDKLQPVFYGLITAINFTFPRTGTPEMVVTGMDLSFKLMRGQQTRMWNDKKISEVVSEIAQDHGFTTKDVDATTEKIPFLSKGNESDYQFLHKLATMLNYEFFVVGKKLYFRKKVSDKTPLMTLTYMKNLTEFSLEQNLSDQVTKVEARSWDVKNKKVEVGTSGTINKTGSGTKTGVNLLSSIGGEYIEYVYADLESQQHAQDVAAAVLNERALRLVTGDGECVGMPEIQAGRFIKIEGLGTKLDQAYVVTRVTHTLDSSGYRTQFQVQGNVV